MSAISPCLLKTIRELQSFEIFKNSALGGGTNLAVRHGHRISTDIDIFFPHIIGKAGFERIKTKVTSRAISFFIENEPFLPVTPLVLYFAARY